MSVDTFVKPARQGSSVGVSKARTADDFRAALAEGFRHELEKGGYPLVAEPAADVVEMQAAIVNLYITAPDVSMRVQKFVKRCAARRPRGVESSKTGWPSTAAVGCAAARARNCGMSAGSCWPSASICSACE